MTFWIFSTCLLAACLLAGLRWFLRTVTFIGKVSKGPAIAPSGKSAVLLIDLQSCFWDDDTYCASTKQQVETTLTTLTQIAKKDGTPVIALRQEWSTPSTKLLAKSLMGGKAIAGANDTGLAAPFANMADHQIIKRIQDGFDTAELNEVLEKHQIDHLQIAGLDGLYCVNKTAQAALARGYRVDVVKDGVATTNPAKFNRVLQDLNTKGARVI